MRDKSTEEKRKERDFRVRNFVLAAFIKCVRCEQDLLQNEAFENKMLLGMANDWRRCAALISLLEPRKGQTSITDEWEKWAQKQKYCRFKGI